ncbi:MAG: hypothetical protein LQ352_008179 [Teloschistes flavicans]|nr:MAG: hypothetical protein LQ352_008179 [Teloschistes flavicans]
MRHLNLLKLSLLPWALIDLVHAAGPRPEAQPPKEIPPHQIYNPVKARPEPKDTPIDNIPGALAVGKQPYLTHQDPDLDIGEIAKQLLELLDKILDALDDTTTSTVPRSGNTPATTITSTISAVPNPALRPQGAAFGCGNAAGIHFSCSTSITNFAALPAATQAGCLCNAYSSADWNAELLGCYSYARTESGLQSYASALASGTDLCATEYQALATPSAAAATTSTSMTSSISSTATSAPGPTGFTTGGSGASVLSLGIYEGLVAGVLWGFIVLVGAL